MELRESNEDHDPPVVVESESRQLAGPEMSRTRRAAEMADPRSLGLGVGRTGTWQLKHGFFFFQVMRVFKIDY